MNRGGRQLPSDLQSREDEIMSNKGIIMRECDKANMVRRVCTGKVDHNTFFRNIHGHLLISGAEAGDVTMLGDMVWEYAARKDMPTIILSSRLEFLHYLQQRQRGGMGNRIMVSAPDSLNYHPMYGMTTHQIRRLLTIAGEEVGCGGMMDRILLYAASVIDIVAAKYPVSLPALSVLLREDDDFIASFANQMGMSNVTANNILGDHEAGILLRRIIEHIEEAFEGVACSESDTKYNFQSGSRGNVSVMAFYQVSSNQRLMNAYLREELYAALKKAPRLRVILDEALFLDESDELLHLLVQTKRQGKIELIVCSENVKAMLPGVSLDFGNICLFQHANAIATEELSGDVFGTYQYHYPVCVAGRPPAILITLKRDMHWQISTEERLKIRAEDLYARQRVFGTSGDNMAVKTTANHNIYLIPVREFVLSDTLEDYPVPAN